MAAAAVPRWLCCSVGWASAPIGASGWRTLWAPLGSCGCSSLGWRDAAAGVPGCSCCLVAVAPPLAGVLPSRGLQQLVCVHHYCCNPTHVAPSYGRPCRPDLPFPEVQLLILAWVPPLRLLQLLPVAPPLSNLRTSRFTRTPCSTFVRPSPVPQVTEEQIKAAVAEEVEANKEKLLAERCVCIRPVLGKGWRWLGGWVGVF